MEKVRPRIFLVKFPLTIVAMMVSTPLVAGATPKQGDTPASDTGHANIVGSAAAQLISEGVVGVVLDAAGIPISGALILPTATGNSGPVPDMAVTSGQDGVFAWRLMPGRYRIEAIVDGRAIARADVTVTGNTVTTIQLRAVD
jgi:hypothetical protein